MKTILTAICLLFLYAVNVFGQKTTREQYIKQYRDIAIAQMHKHKIPASIILAQGCLESGDGNSVLARKANNHFGIKCHNGWKGSKFKYDDDQKNECFRKYADVKDSYTDHSYFLISGSRYNSLFDLPVTDYKGWAHGLKAAGYATNPQYAKLLIDIIEKYKLYEYDTPEAYDKYRSREKAAKQARKLEKKRAKLQRKVSKATAKAEKYQAQYDKFVKENFPHLTKVQQENRPAAQNTVVPASSTAKLQHKVNAGDTLYSIAKKYGTSVQKILELNKGIDPKSLKIGTLLILD